MSKLSQKLTPSRATKCMFLLALSISILAPATAFAAHPYEKWAEEFGLDMDVSYDGTRVMTMEAGQFETTEYKAPGKMYTEVYVGNMTSGVILREDLGKAYLLMPSMGFYREESLDDGLLASSNGMEFSEVEKIGSESINGHDCTKFKTRFKDNEGKGAGHVWVSDSGVVMKMDMIYSSRGEKGQRITMEFTQINFREQDPATFELPEGLKPMGFGGMAGLSQILNQNSASTPNEPASDGSDPQTEAAADTQQSDDDLEEAQQRCLTEAVEASKSSKEKKGFGKFMSRVKKKATDLGISKISRVAKDVYVQSATREMLQDAADELEISVEDVERCQNPG